MSGVGELILLEGVDFELACLAISSTLSVVGLVSLFQVSIAVSGEIERAIVEYEKASRDKEYTAHIASIEAGKSRLTTQRLKLRRDLHRLICANLGCTLVSASLCFVNLFRYVGCGADPVAILRILALAALALLFAVLLRFGLWTIMGFKRRGPLSGVRDLQIALARRDWRPVVSNETSPGTGLLVACVRLSTPVLHRLSRLPMVQQVSFKFTLAELLRRMRTAVGLAVVLPPEEQVPQRKGHK